MSPETNSEKPTNSLGDALSQEKLEGMRAVAKENLKGQLETKISDDLEALALAEKDSAFKNSAEIQQIKQELEATLKKIKALENPTEAEVTSLEADREALSNRLSEATQAIEQESASPPVRIDSPAPQQSPKEKKSYMVEGKRDEELAGKIEAESKEKNKEYQEEQLPLVAERLDDQKSKLKEILTKSDLTSEKTELVQEALRETDQFAMNAQALKERGELVNKDTIERFWKRVEKNFDIISEELLVPENLPTEPVTSSLTPIEDEPQVTPQEKTVEPVEPPVSPLKSALDIAMGKTATVVEPPKSVEPAAEEKDAVTGQPLKSALEIAMEKTNKAVSEETQPEGKPLKSAVEIAMEKTENLEADKMATENKEAAESALMEQDIPAEVIEAISKVEKVEDVEKLPEPVKEKVSKGLWDFGFRIKEGVNGFIGGKIKGLAEKRHVESVNKKEADGAVTRLLFAAAEKYNKDARDATQKRADAAAGGSKRLIGQSAYVGGRVLRYGRLLADVARETGLVKWAISTPFSAYTRWATALGMLAESGFDIAKEAQLRQEKFLEWDSEKAAEAAWEIFNKLKDEQKREPSRDELDRAYKEKLPQDILDRLDKGKESGVGNQTMQKLFGIWIEKSMQKIQEDLDNVEKNNSIKPENKELEKQKIYNNFSIRLKDFDRALNDTGTVDTAAMTFRLLSLTAKWVVRAVAVESIYMGGERIFGKIAETLGRQTEADTTAIFERFEAQIGINSHDGLDKAEVLKIDEIIKAEEDGGFPDRAEFIRDHYSSQIAELFKQDTGSVAEKIAKAVGTVETLKPFRFENIINGSGDSVRFSTEQSFRINPDRFGYDAAKDGAVNEWAKKKAAEVIKELADKKYGGKIPDLVHDGDKIIVEMGADGKPHIEFEASSGLPAGHLPEKPAISISPETVSPKTETSVGVDKFEKAWQNTPTDSRDSIVRQYVLEEISKPEYQKGDFPKLSQEKIDAYVQMFNGQWGKIKTPENLGYSLQDFDINLKTYTRQLIEGKFDGSLEPQVFQELQKHTFPIESKDGKIFFVKLFVDQKKDGQFIDLNNQYANGGKWQLFEIDKQGITHQLEHRKGWFGFLRNKTNVFDTKNIKSF